MYVYIGWCVLGVVVGLVTSRQRGKFRIEPALILAVALLVFALFRFGVTGVNSSIVLWGVSLVPIGVIYFLRLVRDRTHDDFE